MDESTVYIILSRAKFDMTLVVNTEDDINIHLRELAEKSMVLTGFELIKSLR